MSGTLRALIEGCGGGDENARVSANYDCLPWRHPHRRPDPWRQSSTARERAADAGVRNVRFEVSDATTYQGRDFDLGSFFDCLHDLANPAGAARHARQALKPEGNCMIVEPFASDHVEGNLTPVGRVYYGTSALICVPVSLVKRGPALGAQAAEQRLRAVVVEQGGFTRFWRATETPFNIVLEARS